MQAIYFISLFLASGAGTLPEEVRLPEVYVEFLWSAPHKNALARQETRGFLLDGKHDHQVCVAVIPRITGGATTLSIEAVDASGHIASRQDYLEFNGSKRCFQADLGQGEPGQWTFRIYLDGAVAGTKGVEVAKDLQSASFSKVSDVPYVLGRPNYDTALSDKEFFGHLVWTMSIGKDGSVTNVKIDEAEGVGVTMKERAIAAGYMSLFPPDPTRDENARYRRELHFSPDN